MLLVLIALSCWGSVYLIDEMLERRYSKKVLKRRLLEVFGYEK